MNILSIGKYLIFTGVILVAIGVLFLFASKIPFIGRLPGDIYIKKDNFTFYFPVATSIIASVIVILILWIFSKK